MTTNGAKQAKNVMTAPAMVPSFIEPRFETAFDAADFEEFAAASTESLSEVAFLISTPQKPQNFASSTIYLPQLGQNITHPPINDIHDCHSTRIEIGCQYFNVHVRADDLRKG